MTAAQCDAPAGTGEGAEDKWVRAALAAAPPPDQATLDRIAQLVASGDDA